MIRYERGVVETVYIGFYFLDSAIGGLSLIRLEGESHLTRNIYTVLDRISVILKSSHGYMDERTRSSVVERWSYEPSVVSSTLTWCTIFGNMALCNPDIY
jgi:hypothetical protein